jgi:hypothetical protein
MIARGSKLPKESYQEESRQEESCQEESRPEKCLGSELTGESQEKLPQRSRSFL